MTVVGNPRSFHKKFAYLVEVDDLQSAGFQKCSELAVEVANVQYFEGGSLIPNKSPGRLSFSDITLERGATRDRDLFDWFEDVAGTASGLGLTDPLYKRNLDVVQQDRDGSNVPLHIYFDGADLWITVNATWVGTQWKATANGKPCSAMRLSETQVEFLHQAATVGTWTTWDKGVSLSLGNANVEFVSSGATGIQQRAYTGAEGYHTGWSSIGGAWNYPLRFASPPSSVTFLQTSKWPASWSQEPFLWQHDETGGTWFGTPGNGAQGNAWFTARVTAY